jgi:hypothetical protein
VKRNSGTPMFNGPSAVVDAVGGRASWKRMANTSRPHMTECAAFYSLWARRNRIVREVIRR